MPVWANNNENVSVERNIYSITPAEQRIIDICEVSGLNRNQVILLQHEGYSDEDILGFSKEEADAILTKGMDNEAKSFYYAQIAQRPFDEYKDLFPNDFFPAEENSINRAGVYCSKCGYTPSPKATWTHATATGGFTADGCFHDDTGTTNDNINTKCYYAKLLAMKAFGVSSSSGLLFDYYMFGENMSADHPDWAHEGNDMQYYHGASVYSPISGVVSYSSASKGQVNIYNSDMGITMNFQHMSGVDGTGKLLEGKTVAEGQFLGYQSNNQAGASHLHIQVCNHKNCTTVHSGQDVDLLCVSPYMEY